MFYTKNRQLQKKVVMLWLYRLHLACRLTKMSCSNHSIRWYKDKMILQFERFRSHDKIKYEEIRLTPVVEHKLLDKKIN